MQVLHHVQQAVSQKAIRHTGIALEEVELEDAGLNTSAFNPPCPLPKW